MYVYRKSILLILVLNLVFVSGLMLFGETQEIKSPEIKGFTLKGKPSYYTPDNLYEYINGAADLYLNFKFKKLSVFEYRNKSKGAITVDIYEHKDINNGFGIYCSEKPSDGNFLNIGTEGYYETGVLNFFKGRYYTKISCFGVKKNEKSILTELAKNFSKQFKTKTGKPEALIGFPEKNKVKNSEKYISQNFLGHSFFHSAFTVDYSLDKTTYQIFIVETDSKAEIKKIIESYLSFLKKKNVEVIKKNGMISFIDPYYKSKGKMYIKYKNNHLWGLFCKDQKKAISIINLIDSRLK